MQGGVWLTLVVQGCSEILFSGLLDKCSRSRDGLAAVWLAIRLLWLFYDDMRSSCNSDPRLRLYAVARGLNVL